MFQHNTALTILCFYNDTLPSKTSLLTRRFDDVRLSSVIINSVHTATVCCRGSVTEDDDVDDDEDAGLLEMRCEVLLVTSVITFNTSFRPTLRTAAVWRLDGLLQPNTSTDRQTDRHINTQTDKSVGDLARYDASLATADLVSSSDSWPTVTVVLCDLSTAARRSYPSDSCYQYRQRTDAAMQTATDMVPENKGRL